MDDDTKRYKIQIKGTAYTFQPADMEAVSRLQLVYAMDPSDQIKLKAIFGILKTAADPAEWDALTDRLREGDVSVEDIGNAWTKLTERTAKDLAKAKDAQ